MKQWQPKDWIVLILVGVIIYFLTLLALSRILGNPPGDNEMSLQFLSAILTIVSMYVGAKISNNKNE